MRLFECHPVIESFKDIEQFFEEIKLNRDDLIVTNSFLYDWKSAAVNGCQIVYQEEFGSGEPSDDMLVNILNSISQSYSRVIGIGGGTIMDLCKLLSLDLSLVDTAEGVQEIFLGKRKVLKKCPLILVPTTCGTGSEVTNVSVMLLRSLNTKMGFADKSMYAEKAVLIPQLISTLPYKPMILSAIDALIHACESYLSPKASVYTRVYALEATRLLLNGFKAIAEHMDNYRNTDVLSDFLCASNLAGIAFGNAGCGAVHAMSYPIGGALHLPHGESNYEVFIPVLRFYDSLDNKGILDNYKAYLSEILGTDKESSIDALEALLEAVYHRRSLIEIGLNDEMIKTFSAEVIQRQQRLLSNALQSLREEDIYAIYKKA